MCTGALEWIEKTRTLGKELDWSREEARLTTPPSGRASSIPCRFPPSLHVSSCLLKALTPPQFLATPLLDLPARPVPIAIPLFHIASSPPIPLRCPFVSAQPRVSAPLLPNIDNLTQSLDIFSFPHSLQPLHPSPQATWPSLFSSMLSLRCLRRYGLIGSTSS